MKVDISNRLKIFSVPMLLTSLSYLVFVSLTCWILEIKLQLLKFNAFFIDFGAIVLAFGFVLLVFRRKIAKFDLQKGKSDFSVFFYLVAIALLATPAVSSMHYLRSELGGMTHVAQVAGIDLANPTHYYTIDSVTFVKERINAKWDSEVTGKNNNQLTVHGDFVVPMEYSNDTTKKNYSIWCGLSYVESFSLKISKNELDACITNYSIDKAAEFKKISDKLPKYYRLLMPSDFRSDGLQQSVIQSKYAGDKFLVLVPEYGDFESRSVFPLGIMIASFLGLSLLWNILILLPSFKNPQPIETASRELSPEQTAAASNSIKASLLIPGKLFKTTPIILYANVFVFLAMVFSGLGFFQFDSISLYKWGANFAPSVADGEVWRLFTSMFLHGGFLHILFNAYGLLMVGFLLEPVIGAKRFAICYVICGLAGSFASGVLNDNIVSVGASGAIFGMFGVLLALSFTKVFLKEQRKSMMWSTIVFIVMNIVNGAKNPAIDNACHIGGLLTGFALGFIVYSRIIHEKENEEGQSNISEFEYEREQVH